MMRSYNTLLVALIAASRLAIPSSHLCSDFLLGNTSDETQHYCWVKPHYTDPASMSEVDGD
jgi:hypothetical protein